ncbi:MAG: YceI family protein [Bacteroidota bacterium]
MNFTKCLASLILLLSLQVLQAQDPLITRNSTTTFFSHAPLEDIEAVNQRTTAAIDLGKQEIVVKMLIQHFEFENALMQEHFNENYMESEEFPAALFQGSFSSEEAIDLNTPGEYTLKIDGKISMHGVTQPLACEATFIVKEEAAVQATTEFMLRPDDFDIAIPSMVVRNIAEEIKVTTILNF